MEDKEISFIEEQIIKEYISEFKSEFDTVTRPLVKFIKKYYAHSLFEIDNDPIFRINNSMASIFIIDNKKTYEKLMSFFKKEAITKFLNKIKHGDQDDGKQN